MRRKQMVKDDGQPRRCVAYYRVSTEEQAKSGLSIQAQREAILRYCRDKGFSLVKEFSDPGASGTDDNRPGFQAMLLAVLEPSANIDAIVVYHTSRFMRNVRLSEFYRDRLRRSGVELLSTDFDAAPDDPNAEMFVIMKAAFDQHESRIIGIRTLAGMREGARQGFFNGSQPPFGFKKEVAERRADAARYKLVPDPEEAKVAQEAFRLYVAQRGAKSVADNLNRRGLLRRGKLWRKDSVLALIDDTTVVGVHCWGKYHGKSRQLRPESEWVKSPVEPIVDHELFDMVQKLRRDRDPERTPGRTGSSPLLLAGLVKCAKCGASFQLETAGKQRADGTTYRYYNCRSFNRIGKTKCDGNRIPVHVLDSAVLEHLGERLFTEERCRQIVRELVDEVGILRKKTDLQRHQMRDELEKVHAKIRTWENAIESGEISISTAGKRLEELQARAAEIEEALKKVVSIGGTPPPYLYSAESIKRFQETVKDMFRDSNGVFAKNYIRFLVENITVHGNEVRIAVKSAAVAGMLAAPVGAAKRLLTAGVEVRTSVESWLRMPSPSRTLSE